VQRTVIAIVSRERGCREDEIGPDTDLVVDLGIGGDDIDPILLELIRIYPIDFSEANLSSHFGSEGFWPWEVPIFVYYIVKYSIQRWILGKSRREIMGRGVLISDIVDSAMAGKWTLSNRTKP
jgi:Protein of unknown function (DUF1493)